MSAKLMERKITLILLGFITAIFLFAVWKNEMNIAILSITYLVVPFVLLFIGIYQYKKAEDKRFLIYASSVLISAIIVIPLLSILFIVIIVVLFGMMPTPT